MATATAQPIAGVSASGENEIMSVFPSIGATGLGRALGRLFESIPLGKCPVKLSYLLFPLPLAPLCALTYFYLKITGQRFMLTNRALVVKTALGHREITRVDLTQIGDAVVRQVDGQQFYRCADIVLLDANGKTIRELPAIPWANVFRQSLLKARDAAVHVKSSLAAIEARQGA